MHLVYLSPFPLLRHPGSDTVFMETKSWSGVLEYARLWPGEVTFASPGGVISGSDQTPAGHVAIRPEGAPIRIVEVPPFAESERQIAALKRLAPDVILTLLHLQAQNLPPQLPVVFTAEFDFAIRKDQVLAQSAGAPRVRAILGLIARERVFRRMVRQAKSIQCNGPAATRAYAPLATQPVSFMDHRITDADVAANSDVVPWDGSRPPRLGFSGRWTRIKGPTYAVRAMAFLRDSLPGVNLTLFGGGELEPELRAIAGDEVRFAGFRDFQTEWKPEVREAVDVMLLPHVQGDPSCTYYESLGSGTPIVGFHNSTLTPLIRRHGIGVATRERSPRALAGAVEAVFADPGEYLAMRARGIDLVRRESWEQVNCLRVEHLVASAKR